MRWTLVPYVSWECTEWSLAYFVYNPNFSNIDIIFEIYYWNLINKIKTDQDTKDYTVQGLEYERYCIKEAQYDPKRLSFLPEYRKGRWAGPPHS
jgi:hypothetical protein